MENFHVKIINSPWKTETCPQGEKCWCRMIVPVEPVLDGEDDEMRIVGSGALHKVYAEYIVDLHNQKFQRKSEQHN